MNGSYIIQANKRCKRKKNESICGICLDKLTNESVHVLTGCGCSFCKTCLIRYFEFVIDTGRSRIFCPSFKCFLKNPIPFEEISALVSQIHREKLQNKNYYLTNNNTNPENNNEFLCTFCNQVSNLSKNQIINQSLNETINDDASENVDNNNNDNSNDNNDNVKLPIQLFKCPNCSKITCTLCHSKLSGEDTKHDCRDINDNVLGELDIKRCPNCNFLIQREGGCAQISCRNCCHVFCWHCLKSLEHDFLLFHYDSGPCKNKLGHSRLSIFFNRAQTISICFGISILMLLASPVILALLPCILTKKCQMCCRKREDSLHQI